MNPSVLRICRFALLWAMLLSSLDAKWTLIETDSFELYSEANANRTRAIAEELIFTRHVFERVFQEDRSPSRLPLKVIVCQESTYRDHFTTSKSGRKRLGGLYTRTFEGAFLIINSRADWKFTRHALIHEYVHYLLDQPGVRYPLWLNEGLAEVFATMRPLGNGRVKLGEPNAYRVPVIQRLALLPFDQFFAVTYDSPEYTTDWRASQIFYAQSWITMHYVMFSDEQNSTTAHLKLMQKAVAGETIDEQAIFDVLGFGYKELNKRLKTYSLTGKSHSPVYEIGNKKELLDFKESEVTEQLIQHLKDVVRISQAKPDTIEQIAEEITSDKRSADPKDSIFGYIFLLKKDIASAARHFEKATDQQSESPYPKLYYAAMNLQLATDSMGFKENTLSEQETIALLTPLFKARQQAGPFSELLYHQIAEVWLSSKIRPTDEHMAILYEGLHHFPEDSRIGYYLAHHYARSSKPDRARELLKRFFRENLPEHLAEDYRKLSGELELALP